MHRSLLTDPGRAPLLATLTGLAGRVSATWTGARGLEDYLRDRPQGVFAGGLLSDASGDRLIVGWWRDALRRTHCFAFAAPYPGPPGPLPSRHPLEWLAPPLAGAWRGRDGRQEFVVACRCGVVGRPEDLAWMGLTCGPCHDREQEGLPPVGHEVARVNLRATSFLVTPGGRLVGWVPWLNGRIEVRAYDPPWDGPPLWERSLPGAGVGAVSDSFVGVWGEGGAVELLDCRDGATRRSVVHEPGAPHGLAFAGAGCQTLVVLGREAVEFWDLPGGGPVVVTRLHSPPGRSAHLAAHPDGSLVAAYTSDGVEVYDVATGRLTDRLAAGQGYAASNGVWCADGGFVGTEWSEGPRPRLARWGPGGTGRWLPRWFGVGSRRQGVTVEGVVEHCIPTPAPYVLTLSAGKLALRDAASLDLIRLAWWPGQPHPTSVHCRADGHLLFGSPAGVVVWPWRELFGVE